MLKPKDIEEGKRIKTLFESLGEEDKNLALGYLSALNDRQVRDRAEEIPVIV